MPRPDCVRHDVKLRPGDPIPDLARVGLCRLCKPGHQGPLATFAQRSCLKGARLAQTLLMSDTKFLVFDTQFLVFDTKFVTFTHGVSLRQCRRRRQRGCPSSSHRGWTVPGTGRGRGRGPGGSAVRARTRASRRWSRLRLCCPFDAKFIILNTKVTDLRPAMIVVRPAASKLTKFSSKNDQKMMDSSNKGRCTW